MTGEGTASNGYETVRLKFWSTVKAEIVTDPPPVLMSGTVVVKVCIPGYGCASDRAAFSGYVEDDGAWELSVSISEAEKGLGGEASAATVGLAGPSSKRVDYAIRGKVGKDGVAKLKLTPLTRSRGNKPLCLGMRVLQQPEGPPAPQEVVSVKGTFIGQKLKANF
jgi:hypothetical protein